MAQPQGFRPPGWYEDPARPGRPRWWDGREWREAPPGPGPGGYGTGPYGRPVAPPNLIEERAAGGRAAVALVFGVIVYGAQVVANAVYLSEAAGLLDKAITDVGRGQQVADPLAGMSSTAATANAIGSLASLGALAVGVLFLVWFHRTLTNAQALGLPLRRSPGWGVAGFLIPIANFWFPYQSANDLFPAGHPARRVVGRWWACWLGAQLLVIGVVLAAFSSTGAMVAMSAIVVALYAAAAINGRQLIAAALDAHLELAVAAGMVPPDFDPATAGTMPFLPSGLGGYPSAGPGAGGPFGGSPAGWPGAPGPDPTTGTMPDPMGGPIGGPAVGAGGDPRPSLGPDAGPTGPAADGPGPADGSWRSAPPPAPPDPWNPRRSDDPPDPWAPR